MFIISYIENAKIYIMVNWGFNATNVPLLDFATHGHQLFFAFI